MKYKRGAGISRRNTRSAIASRGVPANHVFRLQGTRTLYDPVYIEFGKKKPLLNGPLRPPLKGDVK